MTEIYKRRIRIQGQQDDVIGHSIQILDAETNEPIPNVLRATIYLNPTDINKVVFAYYETGENGGIVAKDDQPVEHVAVAENPEIDLTAMEVEEMQR